MSDELNEVLKNICKEIEPNLYQAKDGLIKVSYGNWLGERRVIVEFAANGDEADNRVFDDVDIYPDTMECFDDVIRDIELGDEYNKYLTWSTKGIS